MGFRDLHMGIVFNGPRVNKLNPSADLSYGHSRRQRVNRDDDGYPGYASEEEADYNPFDQLSRPTQNPIKSYGLDAIA